MYSWLKDGFPIDVNEEYLKGDQKSMDALLFKLRTRK
jgi:hypothetical protein